LHQSCRHTDWHVDW